MPSTKRTIQRTNTTIKYHPSSPNSTEIASFTFQSNPPNHTTPIPSSRLITIPPGSTWTTGLHWHEEYVERVRVLKGKARVTYDGVTRDYGPGDGILRFEKFVIHGFGRAGPEGDEDTVLEEWTEPEDGVKVIFFSNILAALVDCKGKPGLSDVIQLGYTLAFVDEYPVILPGPFALKYAAIHGALRLMSGLGWAFGYRPWLEEYTPQHLWDLARRREAGPKEMGTGMEEKKSL